MANPLTGDFEAVVQIAVRQINGLLATLHQNGLDSDPALQVPVRQINGSLATLHQNVLSSGPTLKLLHSVRARVGDAGRWAPDVAAFGDWVLEYQQARPAGPRSPIRDLLVAASPPGLTQKIEGTFKDLDAVIDPSPPDLVRGTLALQLSTVRLSVAGGSTSEVTVHANIRARYEPDPGTTSLPEAINGEVRAVYEVRRVAAGAKTQLLIRPSSQDQKIEFIPAAGSGLTSTDAARITVQVRRFLRESIVMLPVGLPEGSPFAEFKGLGSGPSAAIALPLQLSNNPPPAGGAQGITQSFIGSSGFGFAVSEEHVKGLINIAAIQEAIQQRQITIGISVFGFSGQVTYQLRFSSGPTLDFLAGAIEIAGRVEVETSTFLAPNGFVEFKQRVTLVFDPATQQVDLEAVGEPDVDESFFIPHSWAIDIVKSEIANALLANAPTVRAVFEDGRTSFVTALRTFERSASVTYTELEISPDGVIIRGELSSATRIPPVVQISEANGRRVFTAFESWIPGGRIDRFTWSWVEYPPGSPSLLHGVAKSVTETNRFLLEKPPGISEISQMCLRVVGERVLPDGRTESIAAGTVCEVSEPAVAIDAPSWWETVTVPVWMPDLPDDAALRDGIAAHISVQTDRPQQALTQNALVFFPDWQSSAPFDALVRGVETMRRPLVALTVFVILPAGSFDSSRREVEARLGAIPSPVAARVQVAEDTEGGWSRTFDVNDAPSLFLINARREFVWKAAGELEPAAIAVALDQHVVPTSGPRFRPLRLHVSVGDLAPNVYFRDVRGNEGVLHRLRGLSVLMIFWQSWSAPCLAELRRLRRLQNAGQRGAPFIVAFHGGAPRKDFDDICKEYGLSLTIVQDAEHRVAREFGVRCWPTKFAIDPDGRIERIQLGIEPDLSRRANR
jgi:peroxiredoxin